MDKLILTRSLIIYTFIFIFSMGLAFLVQRSRPRSERTMNIWVRIVSWACIVPLFIIPAYLGGMAFLFLVALLVGLGLKEYLIVTKTIQQKLHSWLAYTLSFAFVFAAFFNLKEIFYSLPVLAILTMLLVPVFTQRYQNTVYLNSVSLLGILYVGFMFSHLILIRNLSSGFGYIILIGTLAAAEDNIAYAVGKIFGKGKKRLIPDISPNKTVIGSLGGIIGTVLVAWLFKFTVPNLTLSQCLLLGFLLSLTGQLGDLVISALKRDMQVKDMGSLIPGHGGVLDRFDSWVFSAPFAYYYLRLFTH